MEDETLPKERRAEARRRYLREYDALLSRVPDNGTWVYYGDVPLCTRCAMRLAEEDRAAMRSRPL
jgi:hypothetical protein